MSFWLLGWLIPFCLFGCAGKTSVKDEVPGQVNGEYLLFFSAVQGNPLCMFVSIQKVRAPGVVRSPRTKWQVHAWTLTPGASRCLFTKTGKDKQDPMAPLFWKNDTLLFTTDQDQFVFFKPLGLHKLLLLTDTIFPGRVRRSGQEEIQYGLLPSTLYWNNLGVKGSLFFERRVLSESASPATFLPLTGLKPGGKVFALWSPDDIFLHIEKSPDADPGRSSFFALMQNRRGKWEETYDVTFREPACAFDPASCRGTEDDRFQLDIPLWSMEGTMESLHEVRWGVEAKALEEGSEQKDEEGRRILWTSLEALPDAIEGVPVDFCLLKGSLILERETKAVYGIGMMGKSS